MEHFCLLFSTWVKSAIGAMTSRLPPRHDCPLTSRRDLHKATESLIGPIFFIFENFYFRECWSTVGSTAGKSKINLDLISCDRVGTRLEIG